MIHREDWPIAFMGLVICALTFLAGWVFLVEAGDWERFKVEHHCVISAHIPGEVTTGVSSNGSVVIGSTPAKTGWYCDNGITYFR